MLPLMLAAAPFAAAGASLLGNLMGQSNQQAINAQNYWAQVQQNASNQAAADALQNKQIAHTTSINDQNIALQREINQSNIDFAREQRMFSMDQANRLNLMALEDKAKDRQLQQDFAQMGIQWRVQDALAAGIHPIHALSGGGAAYSPSAISLSGGSFSSPQMVAPQAQGASLGSAPMGTAPRAVAGDNFSRMGQDLSRALLSAGNQAMKNDAFEGAYQELTLKNLSLRNDLIASQIARASQAGGIQKCVSDNPWVPPVLEIQEAKETPIAGIPQMRGSSDAEDFETRFGQVGEFVGGAHNVYVANKMNEGLATKYFQWVNSNMIAQQMRDAYFRDVYDAPKYRQQGIPYLRENWKGHY